MSTGDYAKAQWLPSPNFWPGGDGNAYIVIHGTASGGPQTGYQLATSAEFTDGKSASVHYINDVDGSVYQIVHEADSAWGNCCTAGASPFVNAPGRPAGYNWNRCTISIENVKHSSDNSEPLTTAQYQSLLALVRDICSRQKIPLSYGTPTQAGIIFHHDLDPVNKAKCPGTFPYDTFLQDLAGSTPQGVPVKLDTNGCVMTVPKSYQLESGESEDLCGPWSVVAVANSVPPGQTPKATNEDIDTFTDNMVDKLFGPGGFDHINFQGVMPADMITIMSYVRDTTGLIHYWVIDPKNIPLAVAAGYPCLFSLPEGHVKAWDKGSNSWVQAYPWNLPNAYHVLPVAGFDNNHNWICPDQLNNSFQGYWPVTYQGSQIVGSISWACMLQVVGPDKNNPYLKAIPSGDPASWPAGFNAQNFGAPTPAPAPAPTPAANTNQQKQFQDIWNCSVALLGGSAPSYTSGIANEWKNKYMPKYFLGPPVTPEFHTVDWTGKDIIVQLFLNGVCQYTLNVGGRWWLGDKEITF